MMERLSAYKRVGAIVVVFAVIVIIGVLTIKHNPAGGSATSDGQLAGSAATTFTDGTYKVGRDIAPGNYESLNNSPACRWHALRGFDGTVDEIGLGGAGDGTNNITIFESDKGFEVHNCTTWIKQ
jgi:hypothetical protein